MYTVWSNKKGGIMSNKKLDWHIKMAKFEIYKRVENTRYVNQNILQLKEIESSLPNFPENEKEYKEKIKNLQEKIRQE